MFEKIIPSKYHKKAYRLKQEILKNYFLKSYSQEGEDMVLNRIFNGKTSGFYVDVGAHHPMRFSNTFFFYKKGWSGMNIDAMPGSMKLFEQQRPRDINIEAAVSDKTEELTYYAFEDPALNGFDEKLSGERIKSGEHLLFKKKINTLPLQEILRQYLPANTEIDFLSIDVEGNDFKILLSNNWEKITPKMVLVECLESDISSILSNPIYDFMTERNYSFFSKTMHTCFFIQKNFLYAIQQ